MTHMIDKIENANIDAATYLDNGKIDYRRKLVKARDVEASAEQSKAHLINLEARLLNGDDSITVEQQIAAEVGVKRSAMLIEGAWKQVEQAKEAIERLDSHMSEFVADVIALNAYELGLHDANIVVMKFKPEDDEIPTSKTLVIAQHEPTELHGGGTMSGEAKMWTYGGASLDPAKVRDVFGKYTDHPRGVEFGNWPGISLKVRHVHAPEPIITTPSANGLAQIFANHGKMLNRRPQSVDSVSLWAIVPKEGDFTASANGTMVTANGQVAVGSHSRVQGYTVGDIQDKMTDFMTHFGIGQFIAGVGILESVEVTDAALAEPGGLLLSFTATGRRKAPAGK